MAEGLDAASFEFYEGIRILIPGFLAVAALDGGAIALDLRPGGFGLGIAEFIIVAILAGLAFYYIDLPAKTAVVKPNMPTTLLMSWGIKPHVGKTINVYFVILDTVIPAPIRARALYMGSMFRIGYESIVIFYVSSLVILTYPLVKLEPGTRGVVRLDGILMLATVAVVLLVLYTFRRHLSERGRDSEEFDVEAAMLEVRDWAILLAAVAFVILLEGIPGVPSFVRSLPVLALGALWFVRYFHGYAPGSRRRERRPMSALGASITAGVGLIVALYESMAVTGAGPLDGRERAVAASAAFLAIVLMSARGHEKKLRGSYMTQNTWLRLNKEKVLAEFFYADGTRGGASDGVGILQRLRALASGAGDR